MHPYIREYFHVTLKRDKYFFLTKKGKKIMLAKNNLKFVVKNGPNSGVAIFTNMKALPHIAPRKVNRSQYFIFIIKNPLDGGLKLSKNLNK